MVRDIIKISDENTVIHINVPNAESFHRLLALKMKLITDEHDSSEMNVRLQQNTVFDMKMLKKLVLDCGLDVIDEGGYFIKPFTHGQMFTMLKDKIIDETVLNGLYEITPLMEEYAAEIYVNCKKK